MIAECIGLGIDTKIKLRDAVSDKLGISRRQVLKVIERYTGDDPAQHHWAFSRKARGAMVFELLTKAPEATADPEATIGSP